MRVKLALDGRSDYRAAELNGAPRPGDDEVVALKTWFPMTAGMIEGEADLLSLFLTVGVVKCFDEGFRSGLFHCPGADDGRVPAPMSPAARVLDWRRKWRRP